MDNQAAGSNSGNDSPGPGKDSPGSPGPAGVLGEEIIACAAASIIAFDREQRISVWNQATEAITGIPAMAALGRRMDDIFGGAAAELREIVGGVIASGKPWQQDQPFACDFPGGNKVTLSSTIAPLLSALGEISGAVIVSAALNSRRREAGASPASLNQRLSLLQSVTAKSVSGLAGGKALQMLVDDVALTFGYKLCAVFTPDADGNKLQLVANHGDGMDAGGLNRDGTFSLTNRHFKETPAALAFLNGRQEVLADMAAIGADPLMKQMAPKFDFQAVAFTPMEYFGERLGVFTVGSSETGGFAADELDFLRTIAGQAASLAGRELISRRLAASDASYRDLYDTAADWMYSLDRDGRILDCNETMARALGYPKAELRGRRIFDFESEKERDLRALSPKATSPYGNFSSERDFITAAGDVVTIEINARLVADDRGKVLQWRSIGRDVTDKHEVERRVKLMAAAIENAQECVIVSDLAGHILSVNAAGAACFGISPEAMAGMTLAELWAERNPAGLQKEIVRASLGRGWQGQLWYRRADGSEFPVFVSSQRVDDEAGQPLALVAISRDISAEHHMTTQILRRNRELAVLNAVTSMAAASLDLESILGACINSVVESMHYDSGMVFLLSEDGKSLDAHAPVNIPNDMLQRVRRAAVGEGYIGSVVATGEAIFADDSLDSPRLLEGMSRRLDFASLAVVPLLSKGRLLGVMMVGTVERHDFSGHEQKLLESVGKTIGGAVDNARLFTSVVEAKSEWESTFDAMTNGISIHAPDFTIVRANQALTALLHATTEELIGKKCFKVFHNLDEPIEDCPHRRAMRSGGSADLLVEEPLLGKTLSFSADPFFDSQGKVMGTVHDIRDITEQEQLRNQVNQAEKLSALGEMAGGVAHDFNNFLTVILGNAQLLLAGSHLGSEDQELLKTIERVAGDAAETVRRIQEFTRVRTSRSFEPVDLSEVIRNAIEVARPRWKDEADARGVSIELSLDIADVPPIKANESELGEVFVNLLVNAADAMDQSGYIAIAARVVDDRVEASISDGGRGMTDEQLRRIFEPFFTTKGPAGSGLGLSVAYGIVMRHGGKIAVRSRLGQGSVFTVSLPVAGAAENAESAAGMEAGPVRPARILVIDDAPLIRQLLDGMLSGMRHQVETAASGPEGIDLFESAAAAGRDFDIVFTDLGMPGMSGWGVAEILKGKRPQMPVILITGWGDQLEPERMKQSKIDKVIAKPFSLEQIRELLGRTLAEGE